MASESYGRAYTQTVLLQLLQELYEMIEYVFFFCVVCPHMCLLHSLRLSYLSLSFPFGGLLGHHRYSSPDAGLERRRLLEDMWTKRLNGAAPTVKTWSRLLSIRVPVVHEEDVSAPPTLFSISSLMLAISALVRKRSYVSLC